MAILMPTAVYLTYFIDQQELKGVMYLLFRTDVLIVTDNFLAMTVA
jgi:hypothetical protein